MNVGGAARVLAAGVAWRATGARAAGRALVRALGHDDPNVSTIAGMLLVQGGGRAAPLVRQAVERGEGIPMSLSVLADVGEAGDVPLLERYTTHPDPRVSRAAAAGLQALAEGDEGLGG